MPRNGTGTYTLPTGNPVVTGTTIESNWANTTLSDVATELTGSLARSGAGGMTGALRLADGIQAAPGLAFSNETGSGFYRAGTGEVWAVVQGAQTLNLDSTGVTVPADKATSIEGTFVFNETGADKDARFEGDTDANLLFVDASTDRIGIGTNTPSYKVDVNGAVAIGGDARVNGNVLGTGATTTVYNASGEVYVRGGTGSKLSLGANNTNDLAVLTSAGDFGIGTASPGAKLAVDSGAAALFANFNSTNANGGFARFQNSGTSIADIGSGSNLLSSGGSATDFGLNSRTGSLIFSTGQIERLRIGASGQLGIAGANYGTSGQVLTSQGSGSAPQWTTAASGDVTLNGTQTLTNKTITGLLETRVAIPASDINLSNGNYFTRTISGTTTFTVSNVPASGTTAAFVLELTNGGSATVNWWSGVKWAGGTAPTLTTSGVDILGFYTHDGGTTWRGLVLAKDSK